MNAELYSNLALVSSVVVYALALIAHAVEWASARTVAKPAAERELASVGAASAASDTAAASAASVSERSAAETLAIGPAGAAGDPPAGPTEEQREVRVDLFGRVGLTLTGLGFLLSVVGMVLRGVAADRAPWGNMYEFTISAMVLIAGAYLLLVWRTGARWLGLPVSLLLLIGNGLAVTVFYVAVAPLVPALHSVWFLIHIIAAAIAGAAFNVAAALSVLYLIKQRAERRGTVTGYLAKMPDSRRLDVLAYRYTAFAFPLWTFAVAAGAVWAEYAWGRYWGWDPKETWALVTWVIYAGYLHARATAGWRGKRAAVIGLIGIASFWFNFIGVNLLVSGLHSYAGV